MDNMSSAGREKSHLSELFLGSTSFPSYQDGLSLNPVLGFFFFGGVCVEF